MQSDSNQFKQYKLYSYDEFKSTSYWQKITDEEKIYYNMMLLLKFHKQIMIYALN